MPIVAAGADPRLPWLAPAIDPIAAAPVVLGAVAHRIAPPPSATVASATIVRHKPGRRALVRYRLATPDQRWSVTVFGKTRARGLDGDTVALLDRLGPTSLGPDGWGIGRVPQVFGVVPAWAMWLQEELPGEPGFAALAGAGGAAVAEQIGGALAELHAAPVAITRIHGIDRELATLRAALSREASGRADLGRRMERLVARLVARCEGLASAPARLLHRDFYPDQVLVGRRIGLVDVDCHAFGDPALDLGNFIAHLIEHDVRKVGSLADRSEAFFRGYRAAGGTVDHRAVEVHTSLALARLVALSTTLPGRSHTTESLLALAERRTP